VGGGAVELLPQATAVSNATMVISKNMMPILFFIAVLRRSFSYFVPSYYLTDFVTDLFPSPVSLLRYTVVPVTGARVGGLPRSGPYTSLTITQEVPQWPVPNNL